MSKRALFNVTVAGTNITTALMPVLLGLQVSDKVGTHTDSADLEIDDTDGRIVLPQLGAPLSIALGWNSEGSASVGATDSARLPAVLRIVGITVAAACRKRMSRNGVRISIDCAMPAQSASRNSWLRVYRPGPARPRSHRRLSGP